MWEVSNVCRSFLRSFTPRKVGKVFLGDISKACNEKLFWLIRYIPFGGKVQSRNYGPNSFPIAYKNKFKIAKSAVLSKFWVAACQLKYFNTSLIFDLISIPISLLDLNNSAATQSDRGQVWDIMNMRRMHFLFYNIHCEIFSSCEMCEVSWIWGWCEISFEMIHLSASVSVLLQSRSCDGKPSLWLHRYHRCERII